MHVITPNESNVIATAAATMTGLASPSRGSGEVSTWKVRMKPGTEGVEHVIDREQVWHVTAGSFAIVVDDSAATAREGQSFVLTAGETRTVTAVDEPAEALVAMPVGGRAVLPGGEVRPVPWAL